MATAKPKVGTGDMTTFNIHHGFAEGLLRGMRSSFLSDPDYHHLTQCETLDDVRLNLTETDYADALADSNTLTPNTLQKAAVEKVGYLKASDVHILLGNFRPWPPASFCGEGFLREFCTRATGSDCSAIYSPLSPQFFVYHYLIIVCPSLLLLITACRRVQVLAHADC
jgi:hypothetical protein